VLNSTVSGLISRSIFRQEISDPASFHGCTYYKEFEPHDLSQFFIEAMLKHVEAVHRESGIREPEAPSDQAALQNVSLDFLRSVAERYRLSHYNYIKPGSARRLAYC